MTDECMALVAHATKSLDSAKDIQRSGHDERAHEGGYAWGEAIKDGETTNRGCDRTHACHSEALAIVQAQIWKMLRPVDLPLIERLKFRSSIFRFDETPTGGRHEEG